MVASGVFVPRFVLFVSDFSGVGINAFYGFATNGGVCGQNLYAKGHIFCSCYGLGWCGLNRRS